LKITGDSTRLSILFPSPDGEFLYSVGTKYAEGADQTLCVTRLAPDQATTICREVRPHQTGVRFLAAPTSFEAVDAGLGHVFSTAGDTDVRLFAVENTSEAAEVEEVYQVRELSSLELPGCEIVCGAFSPDGTVLFVLTRESDVYTGKGAAPPADETIPVDLCTLIAFSVSAESGLRVEKTASFLLRGVSQKTRISVARSFLVVATQTDLYHMCLDEFGPAGMGRIVLRSGSGDLGCDGLSCAPQALSRHTEAHGCLVAAITIQEPSQSATQVTQVMTHDLLVRISDRGLSDVVRNPHGTRIKSLDCYEESESVYALYLDKESRQVVSLRPCSEAVESLPRDPATEQEMEAGEGTEVQGGLTGGATGGPTGGRAFLAREGRPTGPIASLRTVSSRGDPFLGSPSHDLASGFDVLSSVIEAVLGGLPASGAADGSAVGAEG